MIFMNYSSIGLENLKFNKNITLDDLSTLPICKKKYF